MAQPIRVLLVEDNPEDAGLILRALRRAGFEPEWQRVDTEPAYLASLQSGLDIILSDYSMPQFSGARALELLKERGLAIPFISISATIGEDVAVEAMRRGAADYLLKDRLGRLGPAVAQALEQSRLRKERQQLEEQFRQSQKMEAIGQLAGGLAHDFNNILTVIQGYTTLLEQGTIEGVAAAQEIGNAVERAAGLSRQLLTFSRKQLMQPRDLDLNGVVMEMSKMLRRTLGVSLTLIVETAPSLPLIYADQGMMEQVLLNLAVNARDAMPEGGRLVIATDLAAIGASVAQEYPDAMSGPAVCLRVSDAGCGISPENLPRVFEPFFTTKDPHKGTGLGLATVQGIVKQHHGCIRLVSEIGVGTTFEIFLPVRRGAIDVAGKKPAEAAAAGGHETILLVEDEPTLRRVVRLALAHFGYAVLEAATARQALALFEHSQRPIDLLLTDLVMPGGNGQDLAENLRAQLPGLRVLYTSGFSADLAESGLAGREGVHFLQKPYSTQKLAQAVRDCLRG